MATKKKPARRSKRTAIDPELLPETSSQGGPVIVVPAEHAARWGGAGADYDRACAPEGRVPSARGGFGWVAVGDGKAIVLDAELPTLWLATPEGGVVVRGPETSGASAQELEALLPADGWSRLVDVLTLLDGRLFLFDSAARGAESPDAIDSDPRPAVAEPGPGTYAVSRASVGRVDFVRFVRAGAPAKTAAMKTKKPKAAKAPPGPAWQTRPTTMQQVPKPARPDPALKMYAYERAADGTFYGTRGVDHATMQVWRMRPGAEPEAISAPGQFVRVALSHDERTLYGITKPGQVYAQPVEGDSSSAALCFEGGAVVWKVASLGPTRAAIAVVDTVKLVDTSVLPWRVIESVSAAPNEVPSLDVLAGGRWLLVGRSPKLFLYAVRDAKLQLVKVYVQSRGGITVHGGRAYLYGDGRGSYDYDEIMNLEEAYAALPVE